MGGPLKLKFVNHFIIYQKRPLRGHLGLAGYTQSSGTGELTYFESIFHTKFSQGYQIFVFSNRISDYHEDMFPKSSAGSEILEKHFNKKLINRST